MSSRPIEENDTERTLTGYLTIPVGVNVDLEVHETENGYMLEVTKEGETEEFEVTNGAKGDKGDDGYSPTVTTTQTASGTNVVITDKNGNHSFEILNGTKGESGEDGFSPIVNVSDTSSGASVSITDKSGEHLFTISNGAQGARGNDGFSPTVVTTQTSSGATVVITDANGPHYFTIANGPVGPKGDPGDAFHIVKTYPSIEAMNLDYSGTDVRIGDYVMIVCDPDDADNGKVYIKGTVQYSFVVDMAGFIRAIPEPPEDVGFYNLKGIRTDDGDAYIWDEALYDKEEVAEIVSWYDEDRDHTETVDLSSLEAGDVVQFSGEIWYDAGSGNMTYWYGISHTFVWPESGSYTYEVTKPNDATATVAITSTSIRVSLSPWSGSGVYIKEPDGDLYSYVPKIYKLSPIEAVEAIDVEAREDITELKSQIDVLEPAATSEAVGKALVAKTVSDGKVIEYEFGEAGGTNIPYLEERIDMLTDVSSIGSPQLVDLSQYVRKETATKYYYQHVDVDFTSNGKYYFNPLGGTQSAVTITIRDANGNNLPYNGTSSVSLGTLSAWDVIERVDNTHVIKYVYSYEANYKANNPRSINYYTFESNIVIMRIDAYYSGDLSAGADKIGVTLNRPTSVYIPYGTNVEYNEEMIDGMFNAFTSENLWYNLPAKRLNPWMQRSYALTDNLLDDRKIDWVGDGNYYKMKPGQTIPVVGGKIIICNKGMYTIRTYTSNNVEASLPNNSTPWTPITLANDVISIRFDVWRGNVSQGIPTDTYEPVYLYYADQTLYPMDDVDRNPVPMAQINGWDINKNVYDYAVPDVQSNVVRMMKTFAIREINRKQDAFRIGTFNIYVNNTRSNRPVVKKELETYGLDLCCFQEARNLTDDGVQLNIGDYLKGWQFQYCNTNEATSTNGRSIASALQILSSEEVSFTDNASNSYLKCVIQMPRYKDYADGLTTLSVYTYHGDVSSATTRTAEVAQMLSAIASDTSDFIIVTGDTNDFSINKDIWTMFANAGLTPVHDGKSETVTDRNNSLDNIFISEHCSCDYYNVINSSEWMYTPPGGSTPQAVSDHDLVYADIAFDFESAIAARS